MPCSWLATFSSFIITPMPYRGYFEIWATPNASTELQVELSRLEFDALMLLSADVKLSMIELIRVQLGLKPKQSALVRQRESDKYIASTGLQRYKMAAKLATECSIKQKRKRNVKGRESI